jgi:hypothetical protein
MSGTTKRLIAKRAKVLAAILFTLLFVEVSPASATSPGATTWGLNPPAEPYETCFARSLCYTIPTEVSGLSGVKAVSAGTLQDLALLNDGTVWAWGHRSNQAPFGPERINGLSGVTAISAGDQEGSLALLEDGTVVTFGPDGEAPVKVSGLSDVKAISAGGDHQLALLGDGKVMAWGLNSAGELGDGTTEGPEVCGYDDETPRYCSRTPVSVVDLSNVTAISAGENHSLALLEGGTVKTWGGNYNGQLGNGSTIGSDVPVTVSGLSGVTAVSAGSEFSLALLATGGVEAWGFNEFGQLGDGIQCAAGDDCHSDAPEPVSNLSEVTAISAGSEHGLALLANRSIMAWGIGRYGELGDWLTETASTPVAVFGLRQVIGISAGLRESLAYGPPIPIVTEATPSAGPEAGRTHVTITGVNFAEATAVHFGSAAAVSFEVTSPTSITAVSPPGFGAQRVTVSDPGGTGVSFYPFRYTPPPTITGRAPNGGPADGGTSVKISGSNLVGATAVRFGSTNASSFTVEVGKKSTTITAVSPSVNVAGSVDVTVTTPGGTSVISKKDEFKYAPTITGLSPSNGSTIGGTSVTVTGAGFALGTSATAFKFGSAKAKGADCTAATTCIVTAPAHAAGTVDVRATVNKTTSTSGVADRFTYG